jgi:hypothetical protein
MDAQWTTELMLDAINGAQLSKITKKSYEDRMFHLEKLLSKSMYAIISDATASIQVIQQNYSNSCSQKYYMSVVMSLFKYVHGLKAHLQRSFDVWQDAFRTVDMSTKNRFKTNAPSDNQMAGFVPYGDIVLKRDTLKRGSIERLLLSMYTYIYPLRSDFNEIRLYNNIVPSVPAPNYICMFRNGACRLVLTEYKTVASYGVFTKDLPLELCKEIKLNLENHSYRDFLFVNRDGHPYTGPSFSKYAHRTFQKIFNKPLTITLIRHAFIMTLDFNRMTIKEKETIAHQMLHGVECQDYYRLIF